MTSRRWRAALDVLRRVPAADANLVPPARLLGARRRIARLARITLYVPIGVMLALLVLSVIAVGPLEGPTLIVAVMVIAWLVLWPIFFVALAVVGKASVYVVALHERYPWMRAITYPVAIVAVIVFGTDGAAADHERGGAFGGGGTSG